MTRNDNRPSHLSSWIFLVPISQPKPLRADGMEFSRLHPEAVKKIRVNPWNPCLKISVKSEIVFPRAKTQRLFFQIVYGPGDTVFHQRFPIFLPYQFNSSSAYQLSYPTCSPSDLLIFCPFPPQSLRSLSQFKLSHRRP